MHASLVSRLRCSSRLRCKVKQTRCLTRLKKPSRGSPTCWSVTSWLVPPITCLKVVAEDTEDFARIHRQHLARSARRGTDAVKLCPANRMQYDRAAGHLNRTEWKQRDPDARKHRECHQYSPKHAKPHNESALIYACRSTDADHKAGKCPRNDYAQESCPPAPLSKIGQSAKPNRAKRQVRGRRPFALAPALPEIFFQIANSGQCPQDTQSSVIVHGVDGQNEKWCECAL